MWRRGGGGGGCARFGSKVTGRSLGVNCDFYSNDLLCQVFYLIFSIWSIVLMVAGLVNKNNQLMTSLHAAHTEGRRSRYVAMVI